MPSTIRHQRPLFVDGFELYAVKTAELARLAGVTVRTVRHYHQIGILTEPERQENGYRSYNMRDLIRVLRIKNLSAAGIPLDEAAIMLDGRGSADDTGKLLEVLDQELARKIELLTFQRKLIASAKASRTAPDLPPTLGRLVALLSATDASALSTSTRDQIVLLAHLGDDDREKMLALFDRFNDSHVLPELLSASQRFEELTASSDDAAVTAVVEDFIAVRASLALASDPGEAALPLDSNTRVLVDTYQRDMLNDAQQTVLARLGSDDDSRIHREKRRP